MNAFKTTTLLFSRSLKPATLVSTALVTTLLAASISQAAPLSSAIDDFNHPQTNNLGIERVYMSDAVAGGGTTTEPTLTDGVLNLKGQILPPRGQPGWASAVLPLGPEGIPQDASQFKGVRMVIKVNTGNISITANSTEVNNFDYHAKPVAVLADGNFHEVKIPFKDMKRAWSEQVPLNTKTLHSLSIVAFSPQQATFDYAIDEISFY